MKTQKISKPKFEKCKDCSTAWNISAVQEVPKTGYICPKCLAKKRKGGV